MWRKNRRKGLQCDGVDLNRNYNSMWGGVSPALDLIKDFNHVFVCVCVCVCV